MTQRDHGTLELFWCPQQKEYLSSPAYRHFVEGLVAIHSTCCVLSHPAPLLEEERDVIGLTARCFDFIDPLFQHRSSPWTAFTADNNPLDTTEIGADYGAEQRL